MARGGLVVVVLLVAMVSAAAALPNSRVVETFPVAGLKCKVRNVPADAGSRVALACPEANPSTVTFCNKGSRTVRIVGQFEAADMGVCEVRLNPITLTAAQVVNYDQFADYVILTIRNFYRSSWFRCLLVNGEKVCIGLTSPPGVSYLTSCVPANC